MSQTREEIILLRNQRLSFLKWKIASVGAIFALCFSTHFDFGPSNMREYAMSSIPLLCLCIDALCTDISLRIHFLGRFLESLKFKNIKTYSTIEEAKDFELYLVDNILKPQQKFIDWKKAKENVLTATKKLLTRDGLIFFELVSIYYSSLGLGAMALLSSFAAKNNDDSCYTPQLVVLTTLLFCMYATCLLISQLDLRRHKMNERARMIEAAETITPIYYRP
ncbi:hypothetical protein [Nitrogeniibacter aestuarii]|uniref:hypothetical protein n=1 Tax=Nitrogeniibacter aestuarii TaxID=2815343 RepID=UPI001E2FE0E2|nr:hypothetical protein [Nitrogeniibacter aestuarii]